MINRSKNNKKGSALIYAAVAGMIISIVIVSLCSITISYHQRTINAVIDKQLYLTSRSVLEILSAEITDQTDAGKKIVNKLSTLNSLEINDFKFDDKYTDKMGEVSVKASLTGSTIKLTATTKKNNRKKTMSVSLNNTKNVQHGSIFPAFYAPNDYNFIDWPEPKENTVDMKHIKIENSFLTNSITLGNTSADSYYYIDKTSNLTFDTNIYVKGTKNIYIFIREGCKNSYSVHFDSIQAATIDGKNYPNVYIIMGKNSYVYINQLSLFFTSYVNAYIYSPYSGSKIFLGNNFWNSTVINGSIISRSKIRNSISDIFLETNYVKPYNEPYISGNTGSSEYKWEVNQYEEE